MDKWQYYFSQVADLTAELSYCEKLKVGAIAVKDRRIICTGYNGTLPGTDNCCEIEIIDDKTGFATLKTKIETEHAERNLVAHAAKHGIALNGASLYITHSPCIQCAKAIINSGFKEVYWKHMFKSDEGLKLLQSLGVATWCTNI
jgi:dCMP deaminase